MTRPDPESKPIQIAVIGLGHIGKYHIQAIQAIPQFRLIAVCDRHNEYVSFAPEGVSFYTDYEELLADESIETVIIATPNHTHYMIAMTVLQAGKHVILEKPAAESMSEIQRLQQTAKKQNCSLYYAFHAATAFDVVWTADYLSDLTISKELGPVTGFSSRFFDPYIQQGSLKPYARGLQNCWLDSGINALSVLHHFIQLSDMEAIHVSASMNAAQILPFTQCNAEFRFTIGSADRSGMGVIMTNWTAGQNHKSTRLIFGESRNVIEMNHTDQKVFRWYPDGKDELLSDVSRGEERLYNHYVGLFEDYLQLKNRDNYSLSMNSEISLMTHELLFKVENAVNKSTVKDHEY